jgi:tetratricopeptide (TPR) repeat protein
LLLAPHNDPAGTRELPQPWKEALRRLFSDYTPIVIGYGGNDGSVMDFLSGLEPGDIREGLYWLYRAEDGVPDSRVMGILKKHNGTLVPTVGFDEFMILLRESLKYPLLHEVIEQRAKERAEKYRNDFIKFSDNLDRRTASPRTAKAVQAVRKALNAAVSNEKTWWAWVLKARAEKDPARAKAIYEQGMVQFHDNPELVCTFARFTAYILKDHKEAEKLYRKAIELDPGNANNIGNFAGFLLARGRVAEARSEADGAWEANAGSIEQVAVEVALYQALMAAAEHRDEDPAIGRLKFVISHGYERLTWCFDDMLAAVNDVLTPGQRTFYRAIADAILDADKVPALDAFDRWKEITPIPIDVPWPKDSPSQA